MRLISNGTESVIKLDAGLDQALVKRRLCPPSQADQATWCPQRTGSELWRATGDHGRINGTLPSVAPSQVHVGHSRHHLPTVRY